MKKTVVEIILVILGVGFSAYAEKLYAEISVTGGILRQKNKNSPNPHLNRLRGRTQKLG